MPVTAWLPLSMIFFGLGPNAVIFLVFLGAFYPIVLNTTFGVRSVDAKLFEAANMLGCNGSSLFRQVVLPAAMPSIFNGLRLGHGFSWILIVVGEMTGVPQGLGAVIMDARMLSRADLVISGMIVIGLAGFFSDRFLIVAVNNRLLRMEPAAPCLIPNAAEPQLGKPTACESKEELKAFSAGMGDQTVEALRDVSLTINKGRIRVPDRRLGLRQVHSAAHRRRLRDGDLGARSRCTARRLRPVPVRSAGWCSRTTRCFRG